MAKLSVNTVNFYDFPKLAKSHNKYLLQFQDGVQPTEWVIRMHKQQLADAARRRGAEKALNIDSVIATTQAQFSSNRNVDVPSQL